MRYVLIVLLLAGCATGPNPYLVEAEAYERYLTAEMQAGRMTRPQAEYLMAQKVNQLRSQQTQDQNARDAALARGLAAAAAVQQSTQPTYQPPTTCQTFQNGPYGTITCR